MLREYNATGQVLRQSRGNPRFTRVNLTGRAVSPSGFPPFGAYSAPRLTTPSHAGDPHRTASFPAPVRVAHAAFAAGSGHGSPIPVPVHLIIPPGFEARAFCAVPYSHPSRNVIAQHGDFLAVGHGSHLLGRAEPSIRRSPEGGAPFGARVDGEGACRAIMQVPRMRPPVGTQPNRGTIAVPGHMSASGSRGVIHRHSAN